MLGGVMSSLPSKDASQKHMAHDGSWMQVEFTLQEELRMEQQAREVLTATNHEEVAKLAASLVKQAAYQQKLLQQAVRYVAELEVKVTLAEDVEDYRPWYKRLLRSQ